jgi:phenylacetate-CoA ligase
MGLPGEPATLEELRAVQAAAWGATYRHAAARSPFYRDHFRRAGLDPDRPPSLDDLGAIPPVDKADLSARNDDLLAVPRDRVADVVTTSGTTGRPLALMLTEGDLRRLAHNERLCFRAAGLGPGDTVLLGVTLDRVFIAGLAYWLGLRDLGCTAVRVGAGVPRMHLELVARLRPSAIVAVPSFLRLVAEHAAEAGVDLRAATVRRLVCIGEPVRRPDFAPNRTGAFLEAAWNARVVSTYGVTELACSCCECGAGRGGHVLPGLLHVEILDEAGAPVADGAPGEVVATALGIEGMPVIRYRTGDVASLVREPCPCGRVTPRLGPVVGRRHQKLKVKGTTLFPSALQAVLEETPGVAAYAIVATSEADLSDAVEVRVACTGPAERVLEALRAAFPARTKITPRLAVATREEIDALQAGDGSRKRRFFLDRRASGKGTADDRR